MSKRTSCLCLLFTALLILGGTSIATSDDSDVDAEDILHGLTKWKDIMDWINGLEVGPISVQDIKSGVAGFVATIGNIVNHLEERQSKTVNISSTVYVTSESDPYRIGYANTYEFSKDGIIHVSSGGELVFGTDFIINGQPATIDLEKGSKVTAMGITVTMPFAMTVVLDGSLSSSLTTTATYYGMSVDGTFVGALDLNGTIDAGPFKFTGTDEKELEFDFEVNAVLDPRSVFQSIKDINKDVFREDNGIDISIKVNKMNVNIASTLVNISGHANDSMVKIASPISTISFDLDYVKVDSAELDVSFFMGVMDVIKLDFESITTTETSEGPRYTVGTVNIDISAMSKKILDLKSTNSEMELSIDDKPHLILYSGSFGITGSTVEMDIDVRSGAIFYCQTGCIVGKFTMEDPSGYIGTMQMPIRKTSGMKFGDVVDIKFAADQNAMIKLTDPSNAITIHPDSGYEIHEMVSDRYIGYEIDPDLGTATAKSSVGEIYVEIEPRDYTVLAGDCEIQAKATDVVELPTPEPRVGMAFVGWNDNYRTYAKYYEMPADDVVLTEIWTNESNSEQISSKTYTISNDRQSIIIDGDTMAGIKAMMSEGEIDTLKIIVGNSTVKLKESNLEMIDGGLTIITTFHDSQDMPEYKKSIGSGMLISVEIWDDDGDVEDIGEAIKVTTIYTNISDTDNCVRSYAIDVHGHMTELKSDYRILQDGASVTFETSGLPYTVMKSSLEPLKGANARLILLSMIPVVLVGIALAIITRKHRGV